MIYQFDVQDISFPILSFFMMVALMLFMTYIWLKVKNWLLVLLIYLFSLILGFYALSIEIPFTPYFQIFFILYQTIVFTMMSFKVVKY